MERAPAIMGAASALEEAAEVGPVLAGDRPNSYVARVAQWKPPALVRPEDAEASFDSVGDTLLADPRHVAGCVTRGEVVQHDVFRREQLGPCDQFVEVNVPHLAGALDGNAVVEEGGLEQQSLRLLELRVALQHLDARVSREAEDRDVVGIVYVLAGPAQLA